ncbi:hypothetical protein CSUNSWCD_269 [Campylobacter showae CSUNSWCD]|uniref:Uncharacterized protein n=1 Tax=Campylobacter showae CSUNSWCD TaxID=1244083 RepID=M5IRV6_9BACT|nr:hypothetical protein CSUNSWCD_269 [Campylobacter showae CSUNSWCD]
MSRRLVKIAVVESAVLLNLSIFLSLFKFQRLYKEAEIKTKTYLKL